MTFSNATLSLIIEDSASGNDTIPSAGINIHIVQLLNSCACHCLSRVTRWLSTGKIPDRRAAVCSKDVLITRAGVVPWPFPCTGGASAKSSTRKTSLEFSRSIRHTVVFVSRLTTMAETGEACSCIRLPKRKNIEKRDVSNPFSLRMKTRGK